MVAVLPVAVARCRRGCFPICREVGAYEIDMPRLGPAEAILNVDPTPDGGYALRILEAFQASWLPEEFANPEVCSWYTPADEQRVAELDKAIEVLREEAMPESVPDYAGFCGKESEE